VVIIALALGVQRMARRHALVRRLPAVETLGCAQVICSDKTGTLTVGAMTVRKIVTSEQMVSVSEEGYSPTGVFVADGTEHTAAEVPLLDDLLRAAAACNDAEFREQHTQPAAIGDPTEIALLVVAAKGGISRDAIEAEMPRLGTLPFDSERKRMTVIRNRGERAWTFVKGAPEVILKRCVALRTAKEVRALSDRARMLQASALRVHDALRVLALAARPLDVMADSEVLEQGLTFLGLTGLQDPRGLKPSTRSSGASVLAFAR
jgi:Ca2+-transporting ATPase